MTNEARSIPLYDSKETQNDTKKIPKQYKTYFRNVLF